MLLDGSQENRAQKQTLTWEILIGCFSNHEVAGITDWVLRKQDIQSLNLYPKYITTQYNKFKNFNITANV